MIEINQLSNGKTIRVAVGDKVKISLEGNPTTGYLWTFPVMPDAISLLAHKYIPNTPQRTGSGGLRLFIVEPTKCGDFELSFDLKRPWEPTPLKTFKVTLEART